jgi:hypothetical protein
MKIMRYLSINPWLSYTYEVHEEFRISYLKYSFVLELVCIVVTLWIPIQVCSTYMNHGLLVCRFQNRTPVIAQYLLLLVALVLLEVEMNSYQSQLVLILTGHRYVFRL